jgi:hypothetical protein
MWMVDDRAGSSRPARAHAGLPLGEYHPQDGDHLCSVWTEPARDRRAARAFFRRAEDEEAVWVQDPSREHLPYDADEIDEVATYSTNHVHLAGGTFDPDRMYAFWRTRADEARARGARHVRGVAEMAWTLQQRPGTERAGAFESALTRVLGPLPISVICQYGSTRFAPGTLLEMLLSHPLVVVGERVFRNPFQVSEGEFAGTLTRLAADPAAALMPMWRYYLRALPGVAEVAAFLCNSMPSFIPAASITVRLGGQAHGWHLDAGRDLLQAVALAAVGSTAISRLFAVWPRGAESSGGSVQTGQQGAVSWVEASFDGHPQCLTLSRRDAFTRFELMRFTTLASAVATALTDLA